MQIELDISRLNKAVRNSKKALEDMKDKNEKLTKKFIREATENLNYISSSAIDKFYEDYIPNIYERTYDLYNTYKVTVTEDDWNIDFDPSFMKEWHRVDDQDPTYIFENSFIRGWHGGAISGEGHPNPGTPYWREPEPTNKMAQRGDSMVFLGVLWIFTKESRWMPSLMSPSPYKEIVRKSKLYMDLETAKYHAAFNQNIEKFQKQVRWNLERIR